MEKRLRREKRGQIGAGKKRVLEEKSYNTVGEKEALTDGGKHISIDMFAQPDENHWGGIRGNSWSKGEQENHSRNQRQRQKRETNERKEGKGFRKEKRAGQPLLPRPKTLKRRRKGRGKIGPQ